MHVIVVGAGIVGLGIAHALLDEGHAVTLLERGEPADRAAGVPSAGNAGWLAHTDSLPLAHPRVIRQAFGYLTDPLGPLAIRPTYLPRMLPWFLRFLAASRPTAVGASTRALVALQSLALPAWQARVRDLGLTGHVRSHGGLYVYDTPAKLAEGERLAAFQRSLGLAVGILGPDEARQLEPALTGPIAGAAFHADAAHISDPRDLTLALHAAALARGATMIRGEAKALVSQPAPGVVLEGDRLSADAVVLAAGAWSKPLAASIGDAVPLDTERGYNVTFRGASGLTRRPIAFEGHGFVATPLESGLRIGGAVEFAGLGAPANHARTRALYTTASRFLKDLPRFEEGEVWMGFRPSIPDSLPVISLASRSPGIVHAFGHGHYGMTQSQATGRLVADLLAGRMPPIDMAPFRVGRF